MFPLCNKISI